MLGRLFTLVNRRNGKMERNHLKCPLCDRMVTEKDGCFTCVDHGDWYRYSAMLLVRAPSVELTGGDPLLLPWEQEASPR